LLFVFLLRFANTVASNNLTTTAKPAYIQSNFTFAKAVEMINTVDENVSKEIIM